MTDHGGHPPLAHIWSSDQPLSARLRQVMAHPSSVKLIKYASVSVISTIVSQVVLLILFGVFRDVRGAGQHRGQRPRHHPLLCAQPPLGLGQGRQVALLA